MDENQNSDERGTDQRSQLPDLPRFPDHLISSVRKRRIWEFWEEDIKSAADVEEIHGLMFQHSDESFFLFRRESRADAKALSLFGEGRVRTVETQRNWFAHPNFKNDYIRIRPNTKWDWEKEILLSGEPLFRLEIELVEFERRRRELQVTTDAIVAAVTPDLPSTPYGRLSLHYNKHQLAYYAVGAILGVLGIVISLA
jgi:hypothetical protein